MNSNGLNKPKKIIQIICQMPQTGCGVGDYAFNLGKQLFDDFGVESQFIVCNLEFNQTNISNEFLFTNLVEKSAKELSAVLAVQMQEGAVVLLHYVGYGYAKRGCPVWLVKGMQCWRRKFPNIRLGIVFHEIYAKGYFWRSSFWLSPLAKQIAAQLFTMSDFCFTSTQVYADILRKLNSRKQNNICVLPVFSNVGESISSSLLSDRKSHLIVFGKSSSRALIYNRYLDVLKVSCRQLKIEEIHDIGEPIKNSLSKIDRIKVIKHGLLMPKDVGELLSEALAGVIFLPSRFILDKSGVFASYCAHRMLPVALTFDKSSKNKFVYDKYCWVPEKNGLFLLKDGQLLADGAYSWYQKHSLAEQAKIFVKFF